MATVAISGPDNVGKTTQIRLLTDRTSATDAGRLDDHDPRWQAAHAQGLANWWFRTVPIEEVVDVLACSYLRRAEHAADLPRLALIDRGMTMLEATVVATVSVRENLDHAHATDRAVNLLAAYAARIGQARACEREILLLHDHNPAVSTARALSREPSTSDVYARYQAALNTHLHAGAHAAETITVSDTSIMDVHHDLCARLNLRVPAITRTNIIALAGLSESGKSTAGEYLHRIHNFDRLKIGYLLDLAATRHRIADVYSLDPTRIAELLVGELDRYAAAHHYQQQISIESLHRDQVTAALKALLGDRLTVVYLDVPEQQRRTRGTAGSDDVVARDATKRARGADQIRHLADVVVDNNGAIVNLQHRLDLLVRTRKWPFLTPRLATVAELRLPAHLSHYLTHLLRLVADPAGPLVDLLAVTGSGSRGKYQHGWSDLDVLVIAETANLPAIRAALADTSAELEHVKLGFTVISTVECRAGALTPRLINTVAAIASGKTPALWSTPSLALPRPDAQTAMDADWADANLAAISIRRLLLHDPLDLRSLYKVTALLAKIIMRSEGQNHPGDREALETFLAFAGLPADPLDDARVSEAPAARLAESVVSWWLASVGGTR